MAALPECTVAQLKRLWMTRCPFAGPSEAYDQEASFDELMLLIRLGRPR